MLQGLRERRFNREIESIRALIRAAAKPFSDGEKAQKERIARAAKDLEYFGRTYFPHYVSSPSSALHKYICEQFPRLIFKSIDTGVGDREADAAPRGNAKSTWTTLILVIWSAVFKYRSFPLIVSETSSQADDFVSFIKAELETNERLSQDFPTACGAGPLWQASAIITKSGVKIRGIGSGEKLRGMRHGSKRPDLVICDDLENDESVESPEQRRKLEKWFFKALTKIGNAGTVYIVIGTILHYDGLLATLLKKAGWKGKKFKAILSYSTALGLWERWEEIFMDAGGGKAEAEASADAFFDEHKEEMLTGAEVLWPEVESYYYLMKMRVSEGPAYFDSEKQNEPINPDDCLFRDEWFQYYEDGDVDLAGLPHGGVVDPSMGKKSAKHDPSAILGGRMKDGTIYLTVADIERRYPDRIIADILVYHEKDPFNMFGVESIQFQEFFKDQLQKESHKKGLTLNVKEIRPNTDKFLRIQTLQPWIKNGWIRFKKAHKALVEQLKYYPKGDHDDGPDALEMLKSMLVTGLAPAACAVSETTGSDYRSERKNGLDGGDYSAERKDDLKGRRPGTGRSNRQGRN